MYNDQVGEKVQTFILKLYVTGMSVASVRAIENIREICDANLKDNYSLEIIDIYKYPGAVLENDIIASPTLIKESPEPQRRMIGDFSDKTKVLRALGIG